MFQSRRKLPEYYIPEDLKNVLLKNTSCLRLTEKGERFSKIIEKLKSIDRLELVECHYLEFLKLCLYLEEFQQNVDLKKFNLYKKKIKQIFIPEVKKPEKELNIVREKPEKELNTVRKKPTYNFKILIKDIDKDHPAKNSYSIRIIETNDTTKKYTLKIIRVLDNYIVVHADKEFYDNYKTDKEYTIKFKLNNYTFRCCHYALTKFDSHAIKFYSFPQKINPIFSFSRNETDVAESNTCKDRWFNNSIMNNPEQKQAVTNIINKSSRPAPYILYGPPGTGKTATLTEAICQISHKNLGKVLICTPSNSAADVLTKRLLKDIDHEKIFRVYNQSRDISLIDKEIKACSNFSQDRLIHTKSKDKEIKACSNFSQDRFIHTKSKDKEIKAFSYFSLKHVIDSKSKSKSKDSSKGTNSQVQAEDFLSKSIIISTLGVCSRFFFLDLKGDFSYIFIDEAGQTTEPEALIAFNMACSNQSSQIVISGDPQQLGPCIRSKFAEPVLGQSILERLMKLELYKKDPNNKYDPRYITKLRRNYRSHPAIIRVSNELYYDNDLIACSTQKSFTTKEFPKNFPILFHSVTGKEQKQKNSTSSYNEKEATAVLAYARYFVGKRFGGKLIKKEDVGIVTPFTLQSKHLQQQLRYRNLDDVEVGTVEIFQGQEKEAIIVSAVRTKTFVHEEREHIGFLSNPRRFNVALTRARAVLVVVGNPTALQVDPDWRHFLQFCQDNNACRGEAFQLREKQELGASEKGRSKTVKSTDLFDAGMQIIEIHDGIVKETPYKSNYRTRQPRLTREQNNWRSLNEFTTRKYEDESLCSSFGDLYLYDSD